VIDKWESTYNPAMFRLTREVRFAVNSEMDESPSGKPVNGHGGFPALAGLGHYFALRITLAGELESSSQYLRNIKEIDEVVRRQGIAIVADAVRRRTALANVPALLLAGVNGAWPGVTLDQLELALSPQLTIGLKVTESPMVRLSQKFEFSAAHRLNNPSLTDEQNRQTFGKCSNPLGHGHNYELQVTLRGEPDADGILIHIPAFERIVTDAVIDKLDHKFLNLEVPEFHEMIPSVENIARIIYRMLKPQLNGKLASVTVWETPKTWCEYEGEE
jgi:6-pyruvoyltetrahydropterin/6-carboxytetrahydropterin synthase